MSSTIGLAGAAILKKGKKRVKYEDTKINGKKIGKQKIIKRNTLKLKTRERKTEN